MTMMLLGNDACTACKQVATMLGRTPLDWKYVDVATIPDYKGDLPVLILEDGTQINGLGPITQYVRSQGFRV
jgi:hypothetical protein